MLEGRIAAARVLKLIDGIVVDQSTGLEDDSDPSLPFTDIRMIEFQDVQFAGSLRGVSFSIRNCEKVAFVGGDGSGVIELLQKFYQPYCFFLFSVMMISLKCVYCLGHLDEL